MKDNLSLKDKILVEALTKKFMNAYDDFLDLMDQIEKEDNNAQCDSQLQQ